MPFFKKMKIFLFILSMIFNLASALLMVISVMQITNVMGLVGGALLIMYSLGGLLNDIAFKLMERSKKNVSEHI